MELDAKTHWSVNHDVMRNLWLDDAGAAGNEQVLFRFRLFNHTAQAALMHDNAPIFLSGLDWIEPLRDQASA